MRTVAQELRALVRVEDELQRRVLAEKITAVAVALYGDER
jgi:hypothetical protein